MSDTVATIERLLADAEQLPDPRARALAKSLAAALVDLVGDGMRRIVELEPALLQRLAADDLIGNLLVLCGMHPDAPAVRAERALRTSVLPGLTIEGVDAVGTGVRVRVSGDANADRVRALVEAVVIARAPDVETIHVELGGKPVTPVDFVSVERLRRDHVNRLCHATRRADDVERCELCALRLDARHEHLYEPRARQVRCACAGCALIIPTSQTGTYRRVPDRCTPIAIDPATVLSNIPVGVAAVIVRDDGRVVAGYPGPAGLVECELDASVRDLLPPLEPEVEALLCSTLATRGAWIVGIDVVFRMIAELRQSWVGMSGGQEAPAAIARVIAGLEIRP